MRAADPSSGEHLGPYRIVGRVGAGGMGVVFKAWDTRLERDVALKILHSEAGADEGHRHRLLAEGRAASALNHPNILRVYDADVDGSTFYLVSEWLEGNSLRTELQRGPLPVKRLLDLAVQIADGLAAAHAMGIVHRDIKPENVMLARDGTARIVDFGLARAEHKAGARADTVAPTETVSLDGGISGTPAYMSPEQARGSLGDFRTDQFSFGALLYEMATGNRAFRRDTTAETLTAVLHDEPKSIAELNARVPTALVWIIEQCLDKDPAERYAATEDLARELRRVRERLRETLIDVKPAAEAAQRRRTIGLTAAVLLAGAALAVVPRAFSTAPSVLRFTPVASEAAYEGTPVWSPDGLSLAWVADVNGVLQVFVRRLTDAVATQVTHGAFDAGQPFWSNDGRSLYFISPAGDGNGLWKIGVAGSARPELVLDNVNHAALDPAGQQLVLLRLDHDSQLFQQLWWAAADGSAPTRDMRAPFSTQGYGLGGQLQFRPDGRFVLMWAFPDSQTAGKDSSFYYLIPVNRAEPIRVVLDAVARTANLTPFSWLPDNRRVVVGASNGRGPSQHLWIADTESSQLTPLTSTHTNETFPSASPDGKRIAYASEEVDFDLVVISEDGRSQRKLLSTARNEMEPAWSPTSDLLAYVTDRSGDVEIWTRSRDGQFEKPIVSQSDFPDPTTTLGTLAFSPDGRTLAYQRRGSDLASIWLTPAAGGTPVRLAIDDVFHYQDAPSWSPDGEWISYVRSNGPGFSLAKTRIGGGETVALLDRVMPFSRSVWSPDGHWLVCETMDGLVKIPAAGGKPDVVIADPLLAYTWSPDSRQIIALMEGESIGHIAMVAIDAVGKEVTVLSPNLGTVPIANQPIRGFSYVRGQGFLTSLASARSDIWLVEGFEMPRRGLRDWFIR